MLIAIIALLNMPQIVNYICTSLRHAHNYQLASARVYIEFINTCIYIFYRIVDHFSSTFNFGNQFMQLLLPHYAANTGRLCRLAATATATATATLE